MIYDSNSQHYWQLTGQYDQINRLLMKQEELSIKKECGRKFFNLGKFKNALAMVRLELHAEGFFVGIP